MSLCVLKTLLEQQRRAYAVKLLKNRDRVLFKDSRGAIKDYLRTGGTIFFLLGSFMIFFEEFGMPTPSVMYDMRNTFSPDFAVFVRRGRLGEDSLSFQQKVQLVKREARRSEIETELHGPLVEKFHHSIS